MMKAKKSSPILIFEGQEDGTHLLAEAQALDNAMCLLGVSVGDKYVTEHPNIRLECLKPAERWSQPTGDEVREVLRLARLSASKAAKVLGLCAKGDRTVRRWIGGDSPIPYPSWALLCDLAGQGRIWKED